MKKVMILLVLVFLAGSAYGQEKLIGGKTLTGIDAQLKLAELNAYKYKIMYEAEQEKYRKEVIKNAFLNGKIQGINNGIDKAAGLLQKGYDSGKLNYKEIWDCGFRINIDTSSVYQRPGKDKKDKRK